MSKDMQKTEEKTNRRMPTFTESVIPIIAMMVILTVGKGYLGYATEPLLLLVAAIAGLIAYRVGVTWDEMMDEICQKIAKGMPAILILTCVGALVGTWMADLLWRTDCKPDLYAGNSIPDYRSSIYRNRYILGLRCYYGCCTDGYCQHFGCKSGSYCRCCNRRFLFR